MRIVRVTLAVAVSALLGGAMLAAPARAQAAVPVDPAGTAARELRADNAVDPQIRTEDGVLRSVTARAGHPLTRPDGVTANAPAETVARAFVHQYEDGFGLTDGTAELATAGVRTTTDGDHIVRFQQQAGGVPVLGGDVVVSTDGSGHILSASGEVTPDAADPGSPQVSDQQAIRTALDTVASAAHTTAAELQADASRWVYDPELIGGPSIGGARQVWRVDVRGRDVQDPHRIVLVDAALGTVLLNLDHNHQIKQRVICDYTNVATSTDAGCASGSSKVARSEGQAASSVNDVNKAYEYTGATYDFYESNFGRDSIDGAGMPIKASVRVCFTGASCPYVNAYWNGEQMVFGNGFASADDVVGHELTHGVTEHMNGLVYAYQSGAINESFSDIMGEFIDQEYGNGTTDGPSYDWQMGEDLPSSIGVIRNMADPTQFGDPDRMTSPNYVGETHFGDPIDPDDSGGVHTNSGVGNKAAYLMTAPGTHTFNGVTVTGIGVPKAAQIYYRTMSLLTSGADYADLAADLDAACASLATTAVAGITTADCAQVTAATTAVEMTTNPVTTSAQAPDVAMCAPGQTVSVDASDGFENGLGAWTVTGDYGDGFVYVTGYAHTGTRSLYALTGDTSAASRQTATWTAQHLPAGRSSYVWFAQSYQFDTRGGTHYDGGRVEYRVGTGAWTDASALFTDGSGYSGTLSGSGAAFVGDSHGYRSSRLDLSAFAGSTVQLRFATIADSASGSSWLIDDVTAYGCTTVGAAVTGLSAAAGAPGTATLNWDAVDGATGYTIAGPLAGLPVTVAGTQLALTGMNPASDYTLTVTPVIDGGAATAVTVRRTSVTLSAPATIAAGASAGLSGTVTVAGGGAPSGAVQLLSRRRGTMSWAIAGTTSVGSSGAFSFTQSPLNSMEYRTETYAGVNQQSNTSAIVTVGVAPTVTVKASTVAVRSGTTVTFSGATKPAHANATTTIQVYYAGSWRTITTTRTGGTGGYSIAAKLTTRGRYAYRAAVAGDTAMAYAASPNLLITIS